MARKIIASRLKRAKVQEDSAAGPRARRLFNIAPSLPRIAARFFNLGPSAPLVPHEQSVLSEGVKPREQDPWPRQRSTNSLGGTDTSAKKSSRRDLPL